MSKRLLASAALLAGLLTQTLPGLRAGEPKLVQKNYLVADLVTPITDPAPRGTEPSKPDSGPMWQSQWKTTANGAHVTTSQQLIELIVHTVAPDSWSGKGGRGTIDYFPLGMTLVVCQTPDVQEQVADLLAALRRLQDQEVAIELRLLKVDDAFVERLGPDFRSILSQPIARIEPESQHCFVNDFAPRKPVSGVVSGDQAEKQNVAFLNQAQLYSFLETLQGSQRTTVMQAPKLTMFNGQVGTLKYLDQQFSITKVEAISNGGSLLFLPKNETCETGVKLSLQPIISGDQHFVRLRVNGTLTDLVSDPEPAPRFDTVTVYKTVVVPDGGTALLYGWKRERQCREENCLPLWSELPFIGELFKSNCDVHYTEHVMLLVTPHVIVPKEEEIVQTGVISNPALVQDDPPSPGTEETSELPPLPASPAAKPMPDANQQNPTTRMLFNSSEDIGQIQKIEPLFWLYEWALHPPIVGDRIQGGIE